jgi:hypothetical protein
MTGAERRADDGRSGISSPTISNDKEVQMADTRRVGAMITPEMVAAGLSAYREFLGDDRPVISDEKDLVIEVYNAMEEAKIP